MQLLKQLFSSRRANIMMILVVLLSFTGFGIYYYRYSELHPSTEDAYVQANVVHIASQVSGPIKEVKVSNHQQVHQGQLLLTIDPQSFQYAVDKAKAQLRLAQQRMASFEAGLQVAQANLQQANSSYHVAQKNVPRILTLVKQGKLPQSQGIEAQGRLDKAQAAVSQAQAQVDEARSKLGARNEKNADVQSAKAALAQAQLDKQHSRITAPAKGHLINFDLRAGTMVNAGQPLFAIIENNPWWVSANFKETDLYRIKPGQKATIKLDMYPKHRFHGVVEHVSYGSGSAFALLPAENASGNWVKVTQRFPVKIKILNPNSNYPLRVGASSQVTIDTAS
jgi:membrane fusion protein (multidrug efflux system)